MDSIIYVLLGWYNALLKYEFVHRCLTFIDSQFPPVAIVCLLLASIVLLIHHEDKMSTKEKPHIFIGFGSVLIVTSALLLLLVLISKVVQSPTVLIIVMSIIAINYIYFGSEFRRAEQARKESNALIDDLGFATTDKGGYWANAINEPVVVNFPIKKIESNFYSEWLVIHNNHIIVNPGCCVQSSENAVDYDFDQPRTYSWNGCTPKARFLWFLVGTPDLWQTITEFKTLRGDKIIHSQKKWKAAYRASLVHDALYQYLKCIPIDKKSVDQLFYQHLREDNVPHWLATIYYYAVRLGGGRGVKPSNNMPKLSSSSFKDINFS